MVLPASYPVLHGTEVYCQVTDGQASEQLAEVIMQRCSNPKSNLPPLDHSTRNPLHHHATLHYTTKYKKRNSTSTSRTKMQQLPISMHQTHHSMYYVCDNFKHSYGICLTFQGFNFIWQTKCVNLQNLDVYGLEDEQTFTDLFSWTTSVSGDQKG